MRSLFVAFCSSLLLAACGGGGGDVSGGGDDGGTDGGPDLFVFSGTYFTGGMVTNGTTSNTVFFGTATADAIGGLSGLISGNQDGVLPPGGATAFTSEYLVDPDGSLWVESFNGGFGGMSEDRSVAAMSAFFGGMNVWLRRDGTYDASLLSGTYRFVAKIAASSSTLLSLGGTISFDGVGAGTFMPEFLNNEGSLQGTANDPLTYTVTAQGDLEIDIRGLQTLTGGVARGGELLALAGGTANGQDPMVLYAVKQRTGATTGQVSGDYTLVLDRFAQTTHDRLGLVGILVADGSSSGQFIDLLGLTPLPSVPVTVADDGQIDLTLDGGYRVRGALSAAGDVAFLAGGIDDGFDPGLMALVRKRVVPSSNDIPVNLAHSASIPQEPPVGAGFADLVGPLLGRREISLGEVPDRGILGVPGVFIGQGERALLQFDLTRLQPGRTVARAELVTVQSAVENAPFALGSLEVDHVATLGQPTYLDYDPPRRPLGNLGTLSSQPTANTVSLDVTAAVLADIADARTTASFLLYFPIQDNDDNQQDRLILDDHGGPGPTPGTRTRLAITYE